jgi:uncharacterized protein (TIGR03437 family)
MGSGGYDGLAVANGVLYTEQNGLLYSVNTANASLTLIGGMTGTPNLATLGSTTTALYGVTNNGSDEVATLFSINPKTGAITAIGPIGASAIPNGQSFYSRLSVGSSTLYLEFNSNLYTVNTTTGAATQVGTSDSNGYLTSVLLLEYGTYYVGAGSGIGTINVTTGQIDPHSTIFGAAGSPVALAPDPLTTPIPAITLVSNAFDTSSTIAPNTWVKIVGSNLSPPGDARTWQLSDFSGTQMPVQLDGVSATVNGNPAYVEYISNTQVNILTPPEAMSGTVSVILTNNSVSTTFTAQAGALSPSFFTFDGTHVVAQNFPSYTDVGPTTLYPGLTYPAQPGTEVILYANGFGQTSVPLVTGSDLQSGALSPLPVVTIGGVQAEVLSANLIGVGEFQFNVMIPASVISGDQPLLATYNGQSTQTATVITIQ